MKKVGNAVAVDLPEDEWRAIAVPCGLAFVRSADYEACGGDIDCATFTVWIAAYRPTQEASSASIEAVMRRRMRQGHAEGSAAVVAGAPSTRFEYTDGARCFHSYFVRCPSGVVVELSLATFLHPTGEIKVELGATARDIFSRLQWLEQWG